jgi:hypothetical protein
VPGAATFTVLEGNGVWGACWAVGTTDVRDNQWHHLVGIYTGPTISIYVDGALQTTGACANQPINYGGTPLYGEIGAKANGQATTPFEGDIDQVVIWNRALSSTDVTTLYGGGSGISLL